MLARTHPWTAAATIAADLGLGWDASPEFQESGLGRVTLTLDGRQQDFNVHFGPTARLSSAIGYAASTSAAVPPLSIAPRIAESTARALRGQGLCYLDLRGNAFVRFPGVHVRVTGARAPLPPELAALRDDSDRSPSSLFSPARAQVVFALLQWPQLATTTHRELAASAGVSIGLAHAVRGALTDQGFVARLGPDPWRAAAWPKAYDVLLDQWSAAFATGLWRRLYQGAYVSDLSTWSTDDDDAHDVAVGGEFGIRADLVPETVTVYLSDLTRDLTHDLRARHRITKSDGHPNTFVCRKFWTVPPGVSTRGEVPWLLTYAEMAAHRDHRARDAAEKLRRRARG